MLTSLCDNGRSLLEGSSTPCVLETDRSIGDLEELSRVVPEVGGIERLRRNMRCDPIGELK